MIRMPGHLADAGIVDDRAAVLPARLAGLETEPLIDNVRRAGGDLVRFRSRLAAALVVDPDPDRPLALTMVALAAWRSGALALRDDALARAGAAPGERLRHVAAAALRLDVREVEPFLSRQATDRFWWPGRAASHGYVCAVGGFAGFGGAWIAPPDDGRALGEPGAFAIRTGDRWWRLDADVWCSRLTPLDSEPAMTDAAGPVSVVCTGDSYLAWLHVREDA